MPPASPATTPSGFRTLYHRHHRFVWGVLRRLGVPERDVEDLLQDVFVVVHRRLDDFEGRSASTTWLYAIAVRVYWNYARRQQHRPMLASESASAMPIVDDSVGPERFAEQREASALLEELLGGLDANKRTAFVLAELEGLSAPEIAKVTGTKTRTVYSRIRAAKQLVEASARRVRARERNDVSVQRIAKAGTSRPPAGLERRAWAALLIRLPDLAPAPVLAGLFTAKVAAVVLAAVGVGVVVVAKTSSTPEIAIVATEPPAPVVLASAPPPSRENPAPNTAASPPVAPPPVEASRVAKRSRPEPPKPSPPEDAAALLLEARRALKGDHPDDALRLLDRHRAKHPDSPLSRERERTRLLALCALGRHEEAATLAESHGLPRACDSTSSE